MRSTKRTWQNVLYVLLLLAAVCLLFRWYAVSNRQRIEEQNLNYAMDSARQTAQSVGNELANAQRRVRNYAYFLSTASEPQEISVETLRELEENTDFDAIRFVNASGVNLTSDGTTSDSLDRDYYAAGMRGESGCTMVTNSRITGRTTMVFYAPVRGGGEVSGVLLGLYYAGDYLQEMLGIDYFGEEATVFLCTREGHVIASSRAGDYDGQLLPDILRETGVIDEETAGGIRESFRQEAEEVGFICAEGSLTDNLCIFHVPDSVYSLAQTFPKSVTQAMVRDANHTGLVLQGILVALFAGYILVLLLHSRRERRTLERENREMGYVISGVRTLFSRFILVDLEEDTYRFLANTVPERDGFEPSGRYADFAAYLSKFLAEEPDRQRFAGQLTPEAVVQALETRPTPSMSTNSSAAWAPPGSTSTLSAWSGRRAGPARSCSSGRMSPG